VRDREKPIKVLGRGELSKALTVHAHRFSASAAEKIVAAGGATTALAPAVAVAGHAE
jgi:large subunit ribosomal protein L15